MAEKRTIELEIQDNSKSLKAQYREAVQELQKVSAQYGETSQEAIKAAKAAADLKDQIGFSKDLVDSFNPDAKFNALTRSVGGALDGFQAFEGALGLVGVDAEKLQETMVRLQSVMALSQGLQGLGEARDSFKQLGIVATNALKGIRSGIAATGIGLLVVALGTVVAYWDDIKAAVSGVSEQQKKLNKDVDKQATASKDIYENAQLQENSLRLQGKSEKEILKIRINKLNTSIADEEARIKGLEETAKLENAAAQRNYEWMKMYIRFTLEGMLYVVRAIALPIDAVIAGANKVSEALGIGQVVATNLNEYISQGFDAAASWGAKLLFDPAQTKAESEATIKEAKKGLAQMKSDRDGFLLELKNSDNKGAQDRINTEKGTVKESLDLTRQKIDKEIELMEEGEAKEKRILEEKAKREKEDLAKSIEGKIYDQEEYAKTQKLIQDNLEKDLQSVTDKYDKLELEAFKAKEQERFKLEDEQFNALQKLRNSARDQELLELAQSYDAKFLAAQNNAELEKALTDQFNKEQAAIVKKYADEDAAKQKEKDDKEKARIKALNEYRLNAAKDTLQVVSDLAELFAGKSEKQQKKAFQVQKAVNIANAVIDTYKAANTALASSPPPFNYIAMAAAITAGLVNVKKIASQQFQSSSSSSGGGGSNAPTGAAPMTANFNTIGSSGINQLAQLQQTPTQAYVVSGEVTSAQALDRNRVQNATL